MDSICQQRAWPLLTSAVVIATTLAGCSSTKVGRTGESSARPATTQQPPLSEMPTSRAQRSGFTSDSSSLVVTVVHREPPSEELLAPPDEPMLPRDPQPTTGDAQALPVTLAAVLEIVNRENPSVAFARSRVLEAFAQLEQAQVLWLPSIRAGINYNKHDGRLQDAEGTNFEASRSALYTGLGANAVGTGSPAVPGVYASFHLADAIFQPRAADQLAASRQAGARATSNDFMLQASLAYLDLLRAEQDRAVAIEIRDLARGLADLTEAYARSGQGTEADFDRAQTELALRESELIRTEETIRVASARLAELLNLDQEMTLLPQEPAVAPIDLIAIDTPVRSLLAQGLATRPEIRERNALVREAVQRLQRERHAPLIPSVLLGVSYGGFGAGTGGQVDSFSDRVDTDVVAYWELRNLGHGEAAARRGARTRVDQAQFRTIAMLNQVAREIVEAHTQVTLRHQQIFVMQRAVKVARDSYERNQERIRNAQGLPLETLQSIQALSQAQRELVRAMIEYNQAQFQLFRAIGWPGSPLVEEVAR